MSVSLRMLHQDDANFILELVNDPMWLRFIGDRNIKTIAQAMAYIRQCQLSFSESGFGLWCVESDNQAAGLCGFVQREFLSQPDLGFALLPKARGKNILQRAIPIAIETLREQGDVACISAITATDNTACMRLLHHAGFDKLGTLYNSSMSEGQAQLFYIKRLDSNTLV